MPARKRWASISAPITAIRITCAQLADEVDLVTFEFESVPAETVAFLSQFVPVYPSAEALRIARDRWFEKSMFKDLGIPTPDFADIQSQADLDAAVAAIGLPAVMKTRTLGLRRQGPEGSAQARRTSPGAFAELGSVPCLLEGFVPFTGEVSLVAVRARDGETRFYPLVHNRHDSGVLALSIASNQSPVTGIGRRLRQPRADQARLRRRGWPSNSSKSMVA